MLSLLPDLQSNLYKVNAIAAQTAVVQASKSPITAASAPSSKRPKVLDSSDDDDDKPLSARTSSSLKPPTSSSSQKHSSSSSKHGSTHSSHDHKKKQQHHSSQSKSRNSSALLGDASSEFKSVGHVFLSSNRTPVDQLIAGILSRWWFVFRLPCTVSSCPSHAPFAGTASSGRLPTISPLWTKLGSPLSVSALCT